MSEWVLILSEYCVGYFYPEKKMLVIQERIIDDHAYIEIWNIDEKEACSIVERVKSLGIA